MNIKITNAAAAQIKTLMGKAPQDAIGLRLNVKTTGCSGNSYAMEYADESSKADDRIESNGATIYISKSYSWMLIGTTIDYIADELGNSRFDFQNPNETGRCGCGESFQVERKEEGKEA
ncbi:MAG TPA: iron-sulfur cluster assembly accessory protein [Alphaproteobacteria bacterium]|nr:iron-sulfur cluster assembly accessory protein [Alphaproteobacteria bacterium]USO06323.1 MAG: iron-sulfur cluster assembly accessory protein [Rhodospirillales bacterium]HOO81129.1 iron-sulfur cluster assembly accessory protein [Alphaproteobacteria bacterium]